MARIILLALLITSSSASAGHADAVRANPPDHVILCERSLSPPAASIDRIDATILGRPYILFDIHNMTDKGWVKMGLDPNASKRALQDLVLIVERTQDKNSLVVKLNRWANQSFKTIQRLEFFPQDPKGFRTIGLSPNQLTLNYQQIQQQFPEGHSSERDHGIGWQTEVDHDGVRRYLQFHEERLVGEFISKYITLGIDVPPDNRNARRYSGDIGESTGDLRTPNRNYRRIGVLTFARFED